MLTHNASSFKPSGVNCVDVQFWEQDVSSALEAHVMYTCDADCNFCGDEPVVLGGLEAIRCCILDRLRNTFDAFHFEQALDNLHSYEIYACLRWSTR